MIKSILFLCAMVLLTTFWRCAPSRNEHSMTIVFSQCIGSDAWRKTMLQEMKRELSFYPDIRFVYVDAHGDSKKQQDQLNFWLTKKPDLFIVSPNEAEPLTPIVDKIYQMGIPVIVTDRKTSSGLYNAYVGADNYEIGFMAAQYLGRRLNGNGQVAEVTGLPRSSAAIERKNGFRDGLRSYPGIKISARLNGQWLYGVAKSEVKKVTNRLKDVHAVFAYNDQMGLGTYQAFQDAWPANKIRIVGVDALPGKDNGLQFVSEGILDASMLYPTGGKESVRTALAILRKQPYKRDNILRSVVVDSSNVQLMRLQADKINSQQHDIDQQQALLQEQRVVYSSQQKMLNILVVSLVLAVVFAGISFYALKANWKKNEQLENQNEEIMDQQQQLLEMAEQVNRASEAKINFFTNISHEFKTPLTLILVPLEEILENKKLAPELKQALLLIKRNALTLLNLVTQLLDLRRTGYENLKLKVRKHNMPLFVQQIARSFGPVAQQRKIALKVVARIQDPMLWFDTELMEKVCYNLLSNAFKFTPDKGEIVLSLFNNEALDRMVIRVDDSGPGIDPSILEHIFEPFYMGEHSFSGSGIGLALSKEIVKLHHGEIEAGYGENGGASISVSLLLGVDHFRPDERTGEEGPVLVDYQQEHVQLALLNREGQQHPSKKTEMDYKQHAMLIIDDHPDLVRFLSDRFEPAFEVFQASNATTGLQLAQSRMPDIIVSDVLMPGGSGLDLTAALKNDIRTSHIPVVLLTAKGSDEQKLEGMRSLADAYITKPFNLEYLQGVVENLICNRASLRLHYSSDVAEWNSEKKISSLDKQFLNQLSAFVEEHLSDSEVGADDICSHMGISRVQLYRKLKALLNCSVNEYIISRKLKRSKSLLEEDIPVNEVAYQSGFSSPSYFSTAFKNKYGITPSIYKKKLASL